MLLFARMARLSHRLGRRSHNSAVAQYQKVIDKHFSNTGDLAWTGQQAARIVAHSDCRINSIATVPRLPDQKATGFQSCEFPYCMFVDQFLANSDQP
jgi:hypothetical protein